MYVLYIAGEDIKPQAQVMLSTEDGKAYAAGNQVFGPVIGVARETLREGFRIAVRDGEIYEDDA